MSLMKAVDIAYVRFAVPDLDKAEAWFSDFGLKRAAREEGRLSMCGAGPGPFLYAAELGEPRFIAAGFEAETRADLKRMAEAGGAMIETLSAPGGGEVVHLKDPDGLGVEIVFGQEKRAAEITPRAPLNDAGSHARLRRPKRLAAGPSSVVRLGHCVLQVSDFRRSERWYKAHLGLLTSDEIKGESGEATGAFLRCDRGDQPTDHHTLFLMQHEQPGFNHAAFEVRDFDDLMIGNTHLTVSGADHAWGIGRHILGSQIFDYWRDPFGFTMEHWTDGDLFTADQPPGTATMAELFGSQWGPGAAEH